MVDVGLLVTICKEALGLGARALRKLRDAKLSPQERELLLAAASTGTFHIITAEQIPGAVVRAGRRSFPAEISPDSCATYVAAFKSLCQRGYVDHDEGILFNLTAAGFDRAKALS